MADFFVIADTGRKARWTLKDETGAVNLMNASEIKLFYQMPGGVRKNKILTKVNPPGTDGIVEYSQAADDFDFEGILNYQIRVNDTGLGITTFLPQGDPIQVRDNLN